MTHTPRKGRFVFKTKGGAFRVYESDMVGDRNPCVESTYKGSLGRGLGFGSAKIFQRLSAGEIYHHGDHTFECEWLESDLARTIRETPRFELVHVK